MRLIALSVGGPREIEYGGRILQTSIFKDRVQGSRHVATLNVETGEKDSFGLKENQGCFFDVNESHAVHL